jgi:hypothetical protein
LPDGCSCARILADRHLVEQLEPADRPAQDKNPKLFATTPEHQAARGTFADISPAYFNRKWQKSVPLPHG